MGVSRVFFGAMSCRGSGLGEASPPVRSRGGAHVGGLRDELSHSYSMYVSTLWYGILLNFNNRSIVVVTIMRQEQADHLLGDPKPGHNKENPNYLHNIPFPGMS